MSAPELRTLTVMQWPADPASYTKAWSTLGEHVAKEQSDFILFPELPFGDWLAGSQDVSDARWDESIEEHRQWIERFGELGVPRIAGTLPNRRDGKRVNTGFLWKEGSLHEVHDKYYLPDEEGFWEATWYERGDGSFDLTEKEGLPAGFLICTELWFFEQARHYGRSGANLVLCPRATPDGTRERWLIGAQTAAICSGSFCLGSNRGNHPDWAGTGWITGAEDGRLLGVTTDEEPFLSCTINLAEAQKAQSTYPRYVR